MEFERFEKITFFWGVLLSSLIGVSPRQSEAVIRPPSGTFIQYQEWMLKLDAQAWHHELQLMREAGISTIVLQWTKYDQTRFYPVRALGNDPTEIILSEADRNKMKVFVGLGFSPEWWKQSLNEDYLKRAASEGLETAGNLWKRYGSHPSFSGWYLPQELSDLDLEDNEIERLRRFYGTLSRGCRKQSGRRLPVALSTFFTRKLPPEGIEYVFTKLLNRTGIDLLMVQDGVGAHPGDEEPNENVLPSLNAFLRAGRHTKTRVWSVIEIFSSSHELSNPTAKRVPAPVERIVEQIAAESPLVERSLMFDFFHYMSPLRGKEQRELYDAYVGHLKSKTGYKRER